MRTNTHIHKYIHIYSDNVHTKHDKQNIYAWKHTCIHTCIKPLTPDPTK